MSSAGARPPLPSPTAPPGCIWPAAAGRETLRRVPFDAATPRHDLIGRHGVEDGSGSSDLVLLQAGDWCLKTSPRRRFADLSAAKAAIVDAARKRVSLGKLLLPDTVLALAEDAGGSAWLWTVAPWTASLRRRMQEADEAGDEPALAAALIAFSEGAAAALTMAARRGLVLDLHPSNFALAAAGLCYLDDDLAAGSALPAIGHVLLRRVEEYEHRPRAVDLFLGSLEELLPARLTAAEAQELGLAAAITETPARSPHAAAARERLIRAVARCRGGEAS